MFKDDRDSAEQSIMWFIIFSLFVILIFSMDVESKLKPDMQGTIENWISLTPNHRLRDAETLQKFIENIETVSTKNDVPATLILSVCYLESSMNLSSVGRRGEIGLMQVHGLAAMGCDLKTEIGQLQCGAKWLSFCRDKCGTWKGALTAYAIGECKTNSKTVKKMVEYRLKFWEKTKKHTGDDQ